VAEAFVAVRIRRQPPIEIVPRGVHSVMETLAPYLVVILRRLLPSEVDVDLSICLWQRQRANGNSRHQRGGREQGKCGFWLFHHRAFTGIQTSHVL
jgi:hypothetical protein